MSSAYDTTLRYTTRTYLCGLSSSKLWRLIQSSYDCDCDCDSYSIKSRLAVSNGVLLKGPSGFTDESITNQIVPDN